MEQDERNQEYEKACAAIDGYPGAGMLFLNTPVPAVGDTFSFVVTRCLCGWFVYFPSFSQSPLTCPACSRDLVIRNKADIAEIVQPITSAN